MFNFDTFLSEFSIEYLFRPGQYPLPPVTLIRSKPMKEGKIFFYTLKSTVKISMRLFRNGSGCSLPLEYVVIVMFAGIWF